MVETFINKKRQSIIGIDRYLWFKYTQDPIYKPIIEILSNGPLTINEIHESYNNQKNTHKSVSSIYRYLNELLDENILIKSGWIIQSAHTSSKVLYDLSAEMIIPKPPEIEIWSSSEGGENLALSIGTILDRHFDRKKPSIQLLKDFFYQFETERYHGLMNTLNELVEASKADMAKKELINKINMSDPFIITNSFYFFSLIYWIVQKKDLDCIVEKLSSCYYDNKTTVDFFGPNNIKKNNNSDSDSSFIDYVEYTPKLIESIDSEIWDTVVWNYNHRAILLLLRKPMTLNEIYKKHYNSILARIDEDKKTGKLTNYNPRKKKKNTIYTYLQVMKKAGLIVEAGRRIREGKALTEILYVKKALYIDKEKHVKEFKSFEWNEITEIVGNMLACANDTSYTDQRKFFTILIDIEKFMVNLFKDDYLKKVTIPPIESTSNFQFEQYNTFFDAVRLIEWFLAIEDKKLFQSQVLSCFSN